MQRKISAIITTDFFCWIPFVIVSFFHTLEVIDATPWYALFSIIILPINSLINPLLYDNKITSFITRSIRRCRTFVMDTITSPDPTLTAVINNPCCSNGILELRGITPKKNTVFVDDGQQPCSSKSAAMKKNTVFVEDGERPCSSKMYHYQKTLC